MTTGPRVELLLDDFLAEGPEIVADRVIDAALLEIDTTTQRPGWFGPWRVQDMTSIKLLATAAVVAVAVGGTLLFSMVIGRPAGQVGNPSPSPSPAPTASPSAAARALTSFTSERYGYTVDVPATWRASPALSNWQYGEIAIVVSPYLDRFQAGPDDPWVDDGFLGIASQPIPDGMTADTWLNGHAQRNMDNGDTSCGGQPDDWTPYELQGNPAIRGALVCEGHPVTEIGFVVGDRGWVIAGDSVVIEAILPTLVLPG